jgi:protein-disulfide isomerase
MENNNKSSLPVAIIGIVLLVAIGAGWWFYNNSRKGPTGNSNNTATKATPAGIPNNAPPGASPAWSQGPPNAPVTIEEFADFQCPTCATMHPKVKELRAAFGDRVRIVFRQYPLQMHPYAYDASCATEAAGMQGKFWEMQNLIFSNQSNWANAATQAEARKIFTDYARTLGLDLDKFGLDMIGLPAKNRVDADMQRGRAIGVGSTPSFYINNQPLGTSLDSLRSAVEQELKKVEAAKQGSSGSGGETANANATANK